MIEKICEEYFVVSHLLARDLLLFNVFFFKFNKSTYFSKIRRKSEYILYATWE